MTPKREISFERFTSILAPRVKTNFAVSKGASKGATPKAGAEDTGAAQVWTPRKKKPKVSPTKDEATTRAGPFSAFGKTYLTQKSMEQAKTAHAAKKDKDKGKSCKGKSGKVSKKEPGNGKTPPTKEWMKTQPCYYHASGKCQRGAKCVLEALTLPSGALWAISTVGSKAPASKRSKVSQSVPGFPPDPRAPLGRMCRTTIQSVQPASHSCPKDKAPKGDLVGAQRCCSYQTQARGTKLGSARCSLNQKRTQ